MSELPYDGYRFKHSKPGEHQPNGGLERFVLVIARTMDDAISAIKEQTTLSREGLHLVDIGSDVLSEARRRGLSNGEARLI